MDEVRVLISHRSHVIAVKWKIMELASEIGFPETTCEELGLVVVELATNVLEHGGGGSIIIDPIGSDGNRGIRLTAEDHGPGIRDLELMMTDGCSTRGGLGYGLGTVNRLMDDMDIVTTPERSRGTQVSARRWLREAAQNPGECPLDIGASTRPHPRWPQNGDAFVIRKWNTSVLVGVIDGLGHGRYAHKASRTALSYIEKHYDQPLDSVFRGVGRACRATRGVVMALARFDWKQNRMSFASIGNIEARIMENKNKIRFITRRGIIGVNAPGPVVTTHEWDPVHVFVLFSDGIVSHWKWEDFPGIASKTATVVAGELLHGLARENDDATVLVVKGAAP